MNHHHGEGPWPCPSCTVGRCVPCTTGGHDACTNTTGESIIGCACTHDTPTPNTRPQEVTHAPSLFT